MAAFFFPSVNNGGPYEPSFRRRPESSSNNA